jgi:hypothetical protein
MASKLLLLAAQIALESLPGPTPKSAPTVAEAVSTAAEEGTCSGEWSGFDFCQATWPGEPVELVVAEVAVGHFESGFQERIQAGQCRRHECDAKFGPGGVFLYHRARSYWQLQRTSFSAPFWEDMTGPELIPTFESARAATRVLGAGYKKCHSLGGAVSWYATHDCSAADRRAAFAEDLARKVKRGLASSR